MNGPTFDPHQYKALQRHEWGVSATGWKQHWALWERAAQHLNERLVSLANITAGHRVLDVATGLGEPALTAARHVGPTGWVVATDLSPQMLALARAEARNLGIEHIEFREMDAEAPDLAPHTFQAIVCRLGLMFLPHPQAALRGLRQLLVPGGWFAAAVWGPPERAPAVSLPLAVVRRARQMPAPPAGTPGVFSMADVARLAQLFSDSGYTAVHTEGLTVTLEYGSAEDFVREREATSASLRGLMAEVPDAERTSIWGAIADAVQPYADATGYLRIPNEVLCVVGQATP